MGWIAHRDVVHPYIAVNERGEEGGVVTHRGRGMVVQRRLCVHHCVALAICSPVCGRWWLCVCQSAYWERYARVGHTFIRAKDGLAAIGDGALEDLLHRRQVVTVRVGLRVPEPLMGHKIEANVPVCAGKVERTHKALLHKHVVWLELLERKEVTHLHRVCREDVLLLVGRLPQTVPVASLRAGLSSVGCPARAHCALAIASQPDTWSAGAAPLRKHNKEGDICVTIWENEARNYPYASSLATDCAPRSLEVRKGEIAS